MDPEEAFDKIDESRQDLMEAIDGLTEEDLTGPAVEGTWTIKDLLGHITAWDESCLAPSLSLARGGAFEGSIEDHNAFNAEQYARRQGMTVTEVLKEMTRVRLELLGALQQLDESQWELDLELPWGQKGKAAHILSGLAWHEEEHTQTILKWRASKG